MEAKRSKIEQLCNAIRLGLEKGRYIPGDRIDAEELASRFQTSLTPVRYALYCLWIEDVLENHGRAGFCVPLLNETDLIDVYESAEDTLAKSCGLLGASGDVTPLRPSLKRRGSDVVTLTRQLFGAIVLAAGRRTLNINIRIANGRLGSIRRIERKFIDDALPELLNIDRLWLKNDANSLRSALFDYHQRRKQLAPSMVALMRENVRRTGA